MKKQKFYITLREATNKPRPNSFKVEGIRTPLYFSEVEGYITEIKDCNGYPVKIGLRYNGFSWEATHIGTGLACTPADHEGKGRWQKDRLLAKLRTIDYKHLESLPLHKKIAAMLAEHSQGKLKTASVYGEFGGCK